VLERAMRLFWAQGYAATPPTTCSAPLALAARASTTLGNKQAL
jgi:hypothetical protein